MISQVFAIFFLYIYIYIYIDIQGSNLRLLKINGIVFYERKKSICGKAPLCSIFLNIISQWVLLLHGETIRFETFILIQLLAKKAYKVAMA